MKKHTIIKDDGVSVEAYCHADLHKAVMWERSDGGVSITPVDPMNRKDGESEDEQIARIISRPPVEHTRYQVVDFWATGLCDRTFRSAWKFGDKRLDFDLAKCKSIAKNRTVADRHSAIDKAKTPDEIKVLIK